MEIILASTSTYRRRLLERLGLEFKCIAPDTDETPLPEESPVDMAKRLAGCKARSVAELYPEALVIGCDQVGAVNGRVLGKPGSFEIAAAQLRHAAGKEVHFYTGIALVCINRDFEQFHVEPFQVRFRKLSEQQIENYLHREEPYDCAGSFKVEGLGIALFEALIGNDPTSLEGLPLIKLTEMLALADIHILGS